MFVRLPLARDGPTSPSTCVRRRRVRESAHVIRDARALCAQWQELHEPETRARVHVSPGDHGRLLFCPWSARADATAREVDEMSDNRAVVEHSHQVNRASWSIHTGSSLRRWSSISRRRVSTSFSNAARTIRSSPRISARMQCQVRASNRAARADPEGARWITCPRATELLGHVDSIAAGNVQRRAAPTKWRGHHFWIRSSCSAVGGLGQ